MARKANSESDYVDIFIRQWELRSAPYRKLRQNAGIYRVVRLGGLLEQEMDQLARKFGLRSSQLQALAALRRLDPEPLTASQISEASILTSGTITSLVDRLIKMKLVTRKPHPQDRRAVLISLTENGRKCTDAALAIRNERLEGLMDILTVAEKDALASILRKLALNLERSTAPARPSEPARETTGVSD